MAMRVRHSLWILSAALVTFAAVAALWIYSWKRSRHQPSRELIALREAERHEYLEYSRLRDEYDEKFDAIEKAEIANGTAGPQGYYSPSELEKLKELNPLKVKLDEQRDKYIETMFKALEKSGD